MYAYIYIYIYMFLLTIVWSSAASRRGVCSVQALVCSISR